MTKGKLLSEKEMKTWIDEKWGYENLPIGGTVPFGGSSIFFKTGDWSPMKAHLDKEKCSKCTRCFFLCPDSAITMDKEGHPIIDFNYCKGCGICAFECPKGALEMKKIR